MPQPVALRLSRNSQPPWLTHLGSPQGSTLRPLLLFPGGGGPGVEVEDSLVLAASPLLQRATPSHGSCSSTAIVLPFVTSTTLRNFVAVLRQGRVTIAKEEIANLEALFSVLEIKIRTSIGAVCETSIFTKGECELLKTKDVKPVEGARANERGCTTPSVSHPLKTFSLLHTVLASPAKRPAVTSPTEDFFTPKEEPTDMPKRRRICAGQVDSFTTASSQLPSAPTKPPQQHDPLTFSPSPSSVQIPLNVTEVPKSPIEAENQQVFTGKDPKEKEKGTKMAIQGEVAPKLAGSETSIVGQDSAGRYRAHCCIMVITLQYVKITIFVFRTAAAKVLCKQAPFCSRAAV